MVLFHPPCTSATLHRYGTRNITVPYAPPTEGFYALLGTHYGTSWFFSLRDHPEWLGYKRREPEIVQCDVIGCADLRIHVRAKGLPSDDAAQGDMHE